jgi:hypothetical protein
VTEPVAAATSVAFVVAAFVIARWTQGISEPGVGAPGVGAPGVGAPRIRGRENPSSDAEPLRAPSHPHARSGGGRRAAVRLSTAPGNDGGEARGRGRDAPGPRGGGRDAPGPQAVADPSPRRLRVDARLVGTAEAEPARGLFGYAALVGAVGLGSVIQHGPDPAWSDLAHDVPLLATLAFVAADALADVTRRPRTWWWWVAPTLAALPLIVAAPRAADLAQVAVAAAAVGLTLARARVHPHLRRPVGWALVLLTLGATIGTLSRAGWPLCDPTSPWQGHGAWHLLAAGALVVLAPVIGHRAVPRGAAHTTARSD